MLVKKVYEISYTFNLKIRQTEQMYTLSIFK